RTAAPAVGHRDGLGRESGRRAGYAALPVEHLPQGVDTGRRRAVALPFFRGHAAPAESARIDGSLEGERRFRANDDAVQFEISWRR
ncbi:MAG: hypothetical protein OXC14_14440, partial [Rhodospirillaceae bacterium]|nr:hypothetical protein [Rhodospirillaceae bacterium]